MQPLLKHDYCSLLHLILNSFLSALASEICGISSYVEEKSLKWATARLMDTRALSLRYCYDSHSCSNSMGLIHSNNVL